MIVAASMGKMLVLGKRQLAGEMSAGSLFKGEVRPLDLLGINSRKEAEPFFNR